MARAPYQVLVFPFYRDSNHTVRFAIFHRSDRDIWQPVAGGGEDGESILETAVRETAEESGIIRPSDTFVPLQSKTMIASNEFPEADWGPEVQEIPEHAFGVEFLSDKIVLSDEHTAYEWLTIEKARERLYWAANIRALNELYDLIET